MKKEKPSRYKEDLLDSCITVIMCNVLELQNYKFYNWHPSYKSSVNVNINLFTMSYRTGEKCPKIGVYRCSTHSGNTIPLSKGETFPPCSWGSGHGTNWVLVSPA